jgi:hypothetical protein
MGLTDEKVVGVPPKIRTKDQVNFGRPVRNVKGTFAFFCCQTKECRSQSAALRNAFDLNKAEIPNRLLSAVEALNFNLVLLKKNSL